MGFLNKLLLISFFTSGLSPIAHSQCSPMRYNFKSFSGLTGGPTLLKSCRDVNGNAVVCSSWAPIFGSESRKYKTLPYSSLDAINDAPYNSGFDNKYKMAGYSAISKDCGVTWKMTRDFAPPIRMTGAASDTTALQNGTNHFATSNDLINFNEGFVSQLVWPTYGSLKQATGRIYPIFFNSKNKWAYTSEPLDSRKPATVIGNSDLTVNDLFYSPWLVTFKSETKKSTDLYFGGWRSNVKLPSGSALPQCENWEQQESITGYTQSDCICPRSTDFKWSVDSCSGDKIFRATNSGSADPTKFMVQGYENGMTEVSNGDSSTFKPIITPAMINNECNKAHGGKCPYKILLVNDPTVVEVPSTDPNNRHFVMYFTGGGLYKHDANLNANLEYAFTHVATSEDGGKTWGNFSLLKRSDTSVHFPGNMAYNPANGSVRAYFQKSTNQIVLMSVSTPDGPESIYLQGDDRNATFVYYINQDQPNYVVKAKRLELTTGNIAEGNYYMLMTCGAGDKSTCANAFDYSSTKTCNASNTMESDGIFKSIAYLDRLDASLKARADFSYAWVPLDNAVIACRNYANAAVAVLNYSPDHWDCATTTSVISHLKSCVDPIVAAAPR